VNDDADFQKILRALKEDRKEKRRESCLFMKKRELTKKKKRELNMKYFDKSTRKSSKDLNIG
jgi:hypothetical protein